MRTLLLCAVVAVCVCGTLGARRRLLVGPPRRPVQSLPIGGWPRSRDGDLPGRPVPGRVPAEQLRLAPRERYPQPPPHQEFDDEFQAPFRPQSPEFFRQDEPFAPEPYRRAPQEPYRQEAEDLFRKQSLESFGQRPQEAFEPQEVFGQRPFVQEDETPEARPVQVKKSAEERRELAAESSVQKRQDYAPLVQRQEPSYSEPVADSRQDAYSLNIPEKKEKQRLEFQVHGQQGPHSYRFGYDTGTGYNRQFRFEERDADGNLKGRYGYYKDGKLRVVNYSATHKGGFHAEGDFGKFPENKY
ncbi:hypothetical protein FJT64_021802 [Amphibalanus amphitrite]|uniref:Uncharacterized protein n=1 Tax=Amphibalanus amphitrite TaxID=1232801 RepID=A0A6A4WWH3_AMPAM|nr:hypothetical protein FJT64_021802 [Amphibalanus amphitrite]